MTPSRPGPTSPESFTTFGALLRHLRRRARLTQRELAVAVDYSEAQISRLEQGQRAPDPASVAARFVAALGLEEEPLWAGRLVELAGGRRTMDDRPRTEDRGPRASGGEQPGSFVERPLLRTKLYVPKGREGLVARPRLYAQLDSALHVPLTLVVAPVGFGKTTLIASWIGDGRLEVADSAEHSKSPICNLQSAICNLPPAMACWLSLDTADNDPSLLLRYLIAALQTALPQVGGAALALLDSPQPPPHTSILVTLLNDLSEAGPCLLVLDDYHLITNRAVHSAVSFLLDHAPPSLHLLIATRQDPPLALARLRARGQLVELRAADLRFGQEEAARLLADTLGLPLSDESIQTLAARTEGWAAGLHLAALALRGKEDREQFITTFAGTHRYVVDYLVEEVLDTLPAHLRAFLLQTSPLERMCGELCDALLGVMRDELQVTSQQRYSLAHRRSSLVPQMNDVESDSHKSQGHLITRHSSLVTPGGYSSLLLADLLRRNLFLIPLDDEGHWFRYHHLFAAVLRSRLVEGASPEAVAELHRRASDWFATNGFVAEAVRHALAAPDIERAAALIEEHAIELVLLSQGATLEGWLRALPAAVRHGRARLSLAQAWLLLSLGHYLAALPWAEQAETALADLPEEQGRPLRGAALAIKALVLSTTGDPHSIDLGWQARALLPDDSPLVRLLAMGQGYSLLASGHPAAAAQLLSDALPHRDDGPLLADRVGVPSFLCLVRLAQGRLREAFRGGEELLALAGRDRRLLAFPSTLVTFSTLGAVLIEQNALDRAEGVLQQGVELGRQVAAGQALIYARFHLALIQAARGDLPGALEQIDALLHAAEQQQIAPTMRREMAGRRALLALCAGDLAAAEGWARAEEERIGAHRPRMTPYDYDRFVLAQVQMARSQWADAAAALHRLREDAEATGFGRFHLWALALLARTRYEQGDERARATLHQALALAAPEGAMRPFIDAGLYDLLRAEEQLLSTQPSADIAMTAYVRRLLAACV